MNTSINYKINLPASDALEQVREIITDYNKNYAGGSLAVSNDWIKAQIQPFASSHYEMLTLSFTPRQPMQMQSSLGFRNDAPAQFMQFSSDIGDGNLFLQFTSKATGSQEIRTLPRRNPVTGTENHTLQSPKDSTPS